jgi:hypothetical protein
MKAYLKLVLIAAIAFAWDRVAWAPQREALAVAEDSLNDPTSCVRQMIERAQELERSYSTAATRPALGDLFEVAQVEHLRTCRCNHFADRYYRRHRVPPRHDAIASAHGVRALVAGRSGIAAPQPWVNLVVLSLRSSQAR